MKAAMTGENSYVCIYKKNQDYLLESKTFHKFPSRHRSSHLCLIDFAHLASSTTAGDVLALGALLSTSHAVTRPGPAGAGALTAKQVDIGAGRGNSTLDAGDGEVSDWDTSGGGTSGAAVLIVLLDDDAILGNVAQGDVVVGDSGDLASSTGDGLDTNAVVRVADRTVLNIDSIDGVVATATNRADGQAVATSARSTGEGDVGARVDGQAVILVVDNSA